MQPETLGQIITFYSYKGGTGRSMALANVATLLAREQSRIGDKGVLMIDWDLEAPGLHRYFRESFAGLFGRTGSIDKELDQKPGLIEIFEQLNERMVERSHVETEQIRGVLRASFKKIRMGHETALDMLIQSEVKNLWVEVKRNGSTSASQMSSKEILAQDEEWVMSALLEKIQARRNPAIERFIQEELSRVLLEEVQPESFALETDQDCLYLLKAGRLDSDYSLRVNSFEWVKLYEKSPLVISMFAERLAHKFRYILIDSRTGETDISGICTRLMPEKLVVVFTANRQSLLGTRDLIRKATTNRRRSADERKLMVYPLPSRIELSEDNLRKEWRSNPEFGYQPLFERLFKEVYELQECRLDSYFNQVQIRHASSYSYGEKIAVASGEIADTLSLTSSYQRFTDILSSESVPWEQMSSSEIQKVIADERGWKQQRKRLLIIATTIVIFLSFLATWQLLQTKRAAKLSWAREVLASAKASQDPLESALLLMELDDQAEPAGGASIAHMISKNALPVLVLRGHSDAVTSCNFSSDGEMIATASADGTARLWNANSGQALRSLVGSSLARVNSARFSPDNSFLVTSYGDASFGGESLAIVWDLETGRVLRQIGSRTNNLSIAHIGPVNDVAFSPNGKYIVTASDDFTARIWDSYTGQSILVLPGSGTSNGHKDIVTSAVYSPDGRYIVTACKDGLARVWDARGGGLIKSLRAYSRGLNTASFSHNGKYILTGGDDGVARIWDWNVDAPPKLLRGDGGPVNSAAFNSDDSVIVTAHADGTAQVWDAVTTNRVIMLRGHAGPVNAVAFSTDGKFIITASADKTARVWRSDFNFDVDSLDWQDLLTYLRNATLTCLTEDQRERLLSESESTARATYEKCESRYGRTPPQ